MTSPTSTYQVIESPVRPRDDSVTSNEDELQDLVDSSEGIRSNRSTDNMSVCSERFIHDQQVTEDVPEGTEPGASGADSSLFLADSFEDLSSEIDAKKLDGTTSSRTRSVNVSKKNKVDHKKIVEEIEDSQNVDYVLNSPTPNEVRQYLGQLETSIEGQQMDSNDVEVVDVEQVFDEARSKRAESVMNTERSNSVEDMHDSNWVRHKKHIFILSEAGKPIYTRYGNEENLVTLMGLMQAIVSFVQDNDDTIRSIKAGEHQVVFLARGPLIFVAVNTGMDSVNQLVLQLTYVYHQVLSVLTFTQLSRIFEQRSNYDLRRLLSGTEKFIDNLLNMMDNDPSFLLQSVRCLPIASNTRDIIGQALQQARDKELVFAILVVDNQLVTMVRPKKLSLHPSDLHLIFNLVSGSTSFQSAESWTPICLPRFDNSGYLYAHISYLSEDCPVCLLLLSTDRNAFFTLSECKNKIMEKFEKHKCIEQLSKAALKGSYGVKEVGIPELWHFIYKSRSTAQFTAPQIGVPYISEDEKERLFGLYLYIHHRIHSSQQSLKIMCYSTQREIMLGWVTSGFELYASFSPLTSKATVLNVVNKLIRWIKKEEDSLFIINSFTF